jgi:cytochrome c oxidase subunit 1
VFLAIIGMSLYLFSKTSGKKIFMPKVAVIIPYLWVIGILIFSTGLSWGGLIGEPRRTNLGMTYLNPKHELFTPEWVPTTTLALLGGIIMFIAGMLFLVVFFGTMLKKRTEEAVLELPESETLHNEKRIPLFDSFKPWLVAMGVVWWWLMYQHFWMPPEIQGLAHPSSLRIILCRCKPVQPRQNRQQQKQ